MLAEKVEEHGVRIWLVNTGWTGGGYGVGTRMKLKHTRTMIRAAMNGALDGAPLYKDPVFGLHSPTACPGVPDEVLIPSKVWEDAEAYHAAVTNLAQLFNANFAQFEHAANAAMLEAAPVSA
jgi:phosphoenolpyruvate carboxykinase (ATP)